jgi:hypothetical protein
MKKIFKHQGSGHYIGSCVIVKAHDLITAEVLIRDILDANGLSNETLNIKDVSNDVFIYINNGDY